MGCASKHEGVVDLWMISGLILDDLEYEGSIQWGGVPEGWEESIDANGATFSGKDDNQRCLKQLIPSLQTWTSLLCGPKDV